MGGVRPAQGTRSSWDFRLTLHFALVRWHLLLMPNITRACRDGDTTASRAGCRVGPRRARGMRWAGLAFGGGLRYPPACLSQRVEDFSGAPWTLCPAGPLGRESGKSPARPDWQLRSCFPHGLESTESPIRRAKLPQQMLPGRLRVRRTGRSRCRGAAWPVTSPVTQHPSNLSSEENPFPRPAI